MGANIINFILSILTPKVFVKLLAYFILFIFIIFLHHQAKNLKEFYKRFFSLISIDLTGRLLSLFISLYILLPYIKLIKPFELVSIKSMNIPMYSKVVIGLLLVDFFQYLTHRLHHRVPILWRLHRLHHFDKLVNALTVLSNHPLEAFSMFILHTFLYVVLDIPLECIYYYTFIAAFHGPVGHSKIKLPKKLEKYLSTIFVTPSFHRIHHLVYMKEGNSNFGGILSIWDKLLSTATYESNKPIIYGISKEQSPRNYRFLDLILNPMK